VSDSIFSVLHPMQINSPVRHYIDFIMAYFFAVLCPKINKIVECVLLFLSSLKLISLALWYKKNGLTYPKA
jgi:hypothetical protein